VKNLLKVLFVMVLMLLVIAPTTAAVPVAATINGQPVNAALVLQVEETPDPGDEPLPLPADTVSAFDNFLNNVFRFLASVSYMPFAAAGVVILTGVFKMVMVKLPKSLQINPVLIALTLQVIVWAAYTLAQRFGYGDQFKTGWDALINVIKALLPLAGSIGLAHEGYELAKRRNWPVVGYVGYTRPKKFTGPVIVEAPKIDTDALVKRVIEQLNVKPGV
jgi:hypothetical protein